VPWRQCVFLFGNYQILIQTADISQPFFEERVLDRKNGIDRRVQYAYDAAGNVLKRTLLGTDGECLESSTRYDLKDRATHRTNPAGGVTRYLYDRNDRLRKEISPYGYEPENDDGAGAAYTYDSRGNRIRTTNALGEVVQELSYNLRNQPVIQKDTFGNRTELSYELDGKIKDVRRSGNHQRILQQYEYNARRQITGVVDGNQNPISYDVDSWGRITGIGFADGVKEGYEYTPAGQVSRTIDGNGNAVQYRYNSLGKISERIDQLGFTETFRYDEEGNLSLHIDRDGRQLQRACNVFGQPVYEKASDAEGKHTNISTWHYDSLGRVTRAVCDGKSYEYIYDAHGNLKEKRSNGKRLVSYTHDRAGQITEIKDPAGVCTRYEYDILGRRSRIFNDDGLEVRYGYDALNRIRHIRYGNGVETAYTYDGDGNIRTLETRAGEDVLLSFAYRYDGNGNRTAKTGMQAGVTLGGVTSEITAGNNALDISYNYDVRGQLLEERRNGASVCYAYDKAGNRIRKTDVQGETRYLYNEKNQLIAEESPADRKQFSYDRQGGIIEEKNLAGIRLFSYNSRHQQTRVETETGSVQENRYDAEGLRFELLENGRRTSFVYHDGELLQEEGREEQGTSYHLGAGMEAFRRGQELSYYHRDEQLSTVFVTDGQGEIRNSYQYDAFGIPLETTEQLNNRIRYTGQQYDDVTGQYYLRARYYNPVAGRFMQEDVYQGDGLNLYAYCGNNPVVYDDPSRYERKACPPQGKISESVDESGRDIVPDKGFSSFKDLKTHLDSPGDGKVWHHIVEQSQITGSGFSSEQVNNINNVIAIPHGKGSIHAKISGYYSSKQFFTGGKTVRQWLAGQDFKTQFDFGMNLLKEYGDVIPSSKGWIFRTFE
jgi:RHS repeat-associated protein